MSSNNNSNNGNNNNVVHSEQYITSNANDDTQLYVQKWSSNQKAGSVELLIVHGYLEHSNRYIEFATYLCTNYNINVTSYDVRGHGKSSGIRAYVDNFSKYHDDLETVLETIPTNSTSAPTRRFILCHSNGGLFTLNYMLKDDHYKNKKSVINSLSGIIMSSPFLEPDNGISVVKKYVAKLLGGILPTMSIPADVKVETLMSDPKKQNEFLNDKVYLHKATIGWAKKAMDIQSEIQQMVDESTSEDDDSPSSSLLQFPLPLLYVYGSEDQIAGPKTSAKTAAALVQNDKTIICRNGEQHEVLNEIDRYELYNIIGNWLLQRKS